MSRSGILVQIQRIASWKLITSFQSKPTERKNKKNELKLLKFYSDYESSGAVLESSTGVQGIRGGSDFDTDSQTNN
jgi:hypothetical protein